MSTIYTDALNNKFLGNCRWGNHDINYSTTNWLKSVGTNASATDWWSDITSILPTMGYTSYVNKGTWAGSAGESILTIRFSGIGENIGIVCDSAPNNAFKTVRFTTSMDQYTNFGGYAGDSYLLNQYDYACCFSSDSFFIFLWSYNASYSAYRNAYSAPTLFFGCKLRDLNTNYDYYTTPSIRSCLGGVVTSPSTFLVMPTVHQTINSNDNRIGHFTTSRQLCLTTGDAMYPIACQGGSPTPTGQWATDMYVFDNNATLGYPCIGRVPNMLLGVGTFTYLKPVELITPPDAGSNLWLPVGQFSGKTLLMRCYAE